MNCEWKFPIHRCFLCRNLQQQSADHAYCSSKSKKWILLILTPLRMHKKVATFFLLRWDFYVTSSLGNSAQLVPVIFELSNGGKSNSKITVKIIGLPVRILTLNLARWVICTYIFEIWREQKIHIFDHSSTLKLSSHLYHYECATYRHFSPSSTQDLCPFSIIGLF